VNSGVFAPGAGSSSIRLISVFYPAANGPATARRGQIPWKEFAKPLKGFWRGGGLQDGAARV
ncbi:MAG: hypothetical protein AAFW01_16575, partial [Pseudomonadota bacterium]